MLAYFERTEHLTKRIYLYVFQTPVQAGMVEVSEGRLSRGSHKLIRAGLAV